MKNNLGISVHPFSHAKEFDGKISEDVSPCLRATDYKAPHCIWEMKTDRVINIGCILYDDHSRTHQQDFVQSAEGICRTIPAGTHGSTPHLLKTLVYDEDMKEDTSILQLPHGYKGWSEYENVCPTITTSSFEHNNFVKTEENMEQEFKTIVGSKQENAYSGSVEDVSPTLTSAMGMGGGMIPMLTDASIEEAKTDNFKKQARLQLPKELEGKKFRVRKLTEREVFRLMDCEEEDIDKIQASGISRSAQYKLAGNSICVGVLYELFRKLFIEPENENQQLSLF